MGNCMWSSNRMRPNRYAGATVEAAPTTEGVNNTTEKMNANSRKRVNEEERRRYEMMTEEQKMMERRRKREENERIKQDYNLERLRITLHKDMETFLLNNILFSVQFFENFYRDRASFTYLRLREQSRMNAEGPGGGLSSSKHKKRASLPDTMQEVVGRWVRLNPPVLNSPTFPPKTPEKTSRSKSYTSLARSSEKLMMPCKELLAPLRIMVVHEDVRVVERDSEEDLYRAIVSEPVPKMPGYVKLRCIGSWPEHQSKEIYESIVREKIAVPEISLPEETDYEHSSDYVRETDSEYSYLGKKLYEKKKDFIPEENSSKSSENSGDEDNDGLDTFDSSFSPGEKLLAGIKKRTAAASISLRPPMKPPSEQLLNPLPLDFEPRTPYTEDDLPSRFNSTGRRDSGTVHNLPPWNSKPITSGRLANNFNKVPEGTLPQPVPKEIENWKFNKSEKYGNIHKNFNSPKPSISTENSDSDYGYATIPPSYTPQLTPRRHGGIPHQCLSKVRYRRIRTNEDEEETEESEEMARRIEEQGGDPGELFITKTFLDPGKFLTAFGEEVRWRDYGYSSTSNIASEYIKTGSDSLSNSDQPKRNTSRKHSSKVSIDSGNGTEEDDDSLQALLGIPTSVSVTPKETTWHSQRDQNGMRFPIEIIPSITIPWPREETFAWLYRSRNPVVVDKRTMERLRVWPGKLVQEVSRTVCHAIAQPNQQHKTLKTPKPHSKQEQSQIPQLGWKLCFCEAERLLDEELTHTQTRCFLFAMLLRRCYLQWEHYGLSQNFVRTAFYWICEKGQLNWPEEEMGYNLRCVLAEMYKGLRKRNLPDYFITDRNVAAEELQIALPKAQKVLHSIDEALSIHVARAISGLQFSDSRVPTLDFKYLIQILTDEQIWKTLNPRLFGLSTETDEEGGTRSTDEDDEIKVQSQMSQPPRMDTNTKKQKHDLSVMNPVNILLPAVKSMAMDKSNAKIPHGEKVVEFPRIGTRYKINEGLKGNRTEDVMENLVRQPEEKHISVKVKVVKSGGGTISSKKQQQKPELSDAFSRLKKADMDREWNAKYRKHLANQKKKDEIKDDSEDEDMFARAESYKPAEISLNQAKRRLLLSFFVKHFEQLGRRCGRDWGAFKVADSYLRHAENLAILLAEHEGVDLNCDDEDGHPGEAKKILKKIRKESEHLKNLRMQKIDRNSRSSDIGRSSARSSERSTVGKQSKQATSVPDLSSLHIHEERQKTERMTASVRQNLNESMEQINEQSSSEDEHL